MRVLSSDVLFHGSGACRALDASADRGKFSVENNAANVAGTGWAYNPFLAVSKPGKVAACGPRNYRTYMAFILRGWLCARSALRKRQTNHQGSACHQAQNGIGHNELPAF
jgi:hypothetical protein